MYHSKVSFELVFGVIRCITSPTSDKWKVVATTAVVESELLKKSMLIHKKVVISVDATMNSK